MDYKELNSALADLNMMVAQLEDLYIENGGEVTEETEALDSQIGSLKDFLSTDGVDVLGRWLKAKEDEKKALKAEKDYIGRKINAVDNTMEFIKARLTQVMKVTDTEKAKGACGYSFARTTSTTTSVDKDILNAHYGKALEGFRATLPSYITLTIGASVSAYDNAQDARPEDKSIFQKTSTETIRFTKPRAAKEV